MVPLLRLTDPAQVRLDETGRSPAFFSRIEGGVVDSTTLAELKSEADRMGKSALRICLHPDALSSLQSMVVLARPGAYFPPHLHLTKSEMYQVLEGEAVLVSFDRQGKVTEARMLGAGGAILARMGPGVFHMVVPMSRDFIYHECRTGPFTPEDNVMAEWAPPSTDLQAGLAFSKRILENLSTLPRI